MSARRITSSALHHLGASPSGWRQQMGTGVGSGLERLVSPPGLQKGAGGKAWSEATWPRAAQGGCKFGQGGSALPCPCTLWPSPGTAGHRAEFWSRAKPRKKALGLGTPCAPHIPSCLGKGWVVCRRDERLQKWAFGEPGKLLSGVCQGGNRLSQALTPLPLEMQGAAGVPCPQPSTPIPSPAPRCPAWHRFD